MSDVEDEKKKLLEVESMFDEELEKCQNILGFTIKRVRGNGTLRVSVFCHSGIIYLLLAFSI